MWDLAGLEDQLCLRNGFIGDRGGEFLRAVRLLPEALLS
jgi:hypothetical protein